MKRHRSAVDGRFVSADDAVADPAHTVAETVRSAPVLHIERMNGHFTKCHLGDGRVLHIFTGADGPGADFHDHPFAADISILAGGYVEQVMSLDGTMREIERREGDIFRNEAGTIHRIICLTAPFVLTEFRPGPHEREPGFYRVIDGALHHRLWHSPDWRRI